MAGHKHTPSSSHSFAWYIIFREILSNPWSTVLVPRYDCPCRWLTHYLPDYQQTVGSREHADDDEFVVVGQTDEVWTCHLNCCFMPFACPSSVSALMLLFALFYNSHNCHLLFCRFADELVTHIDQGFTVLTLMDCLLTGQEWGRSVYIWGDMRRERT